MFEFDEEITKAADALWELAKDREPGSNIWYGEIEKYTGVAYRSGLWNGMRRRFANRLREERGINLLLGYRGALHLCTINEELVDLPAARRLKARRQAGRCLRALAAVKNRSMTAGQKKLLFAQIDATRTAIKANRQWLSAQKSLVGQSVTIDPDKLLRPRRPVVVQAKTSLASAQ